MYLGQGVVVERLRTMLVENACLYKQGKIKNMVSDCNARAGSVLKTSILEIGESEIDSPTLDLQEKIPKGRLLMENGECSATGTNEVNAIVSLDHANEYLTTCIVKG